VAGPGRGRLPDGRHQHDLQGPGLPDGVRAPGEAHGDGTPHFLSGPRIHEFLQEMHREVFAGRDAELLTVGEMPGVTVEDAVLFTDPARGEVDMVFQFEHMELDRAGNVHEVRPLDLRALKASLGRWQAALAERGWNSLYWDNHDQPRAVSRFGDDGTHRCGRPSSWPRCCTCTAGRRTSSRARSSG
jgi:oligo-1,6-glucosidase